MGASALVAVQAVDSQDHGVDDARVAFVRADGQRLSFDGADPATDSVVVTTTSGVIDGLQAAGVASVRVLVANDSAPGETSLVAVVGGPTASPTAAVAVRVTVNISTPTAPDGGRPSPPDGATTDGATSQ